MAMKGIGMSWADTQQFISYFRADGVFVDGELKRVPRATFATGRVDMQGYLDWINHHGYGLDMEVR